MLQTIAFLLILFLSLIGVSELIYFLGSLFFKPKLKPEKHLIVRLDNSCAEQQVLSELFNFRWFGDKFAKKIIFLTNDLTASSAKQLEKQFKSDIAEFKNGVLNERAN